MPTNRWEIIKISDVLAVSNGLYGPHKAMLILAKQKHAMKVGKKVIKFVDYAIFTDALYPGTSPADRYFGYLSSAREVFKEMVEND